MIINSKKMSKDYKDFISKPEISFWLPIISSAILIAASWFNIKNTIELQNQQLGFLIKQNEEILKKYGSVEERYGRLTVQVAKLETLEGIK